MCCLTTAWLRISYNYHGRAPLKTDYVFFSHFQFIQQVFMNMIIIQLQFAAERFKFRFLALLVPFLNYKNRVASRRRNIVHAFWLWTCAMRQVIKHVDFLQVAWQNSTCQIPLRRVGQLPTRLWILDHQQRVCRPFLSLFSSWFSFFFQFQGAFSSFHILSILFKNHPHLHPQQKNNAFIWRSMHNVSMSLN